MAAQGVTPLHCKVRTSGTESMYRIVKTIAVVKSAKLCVKQDQIGKRKKCSQRLLSGWSHKLIGLRASGSTSPLALRTCGFEGYSDVSPRWMDARVKNMGGITSFFDFTESGLSFILKNAPLKADLLSAFVYCELCQSCLNFPVFQKWKYYHYLCESKGVKSEFGFEHKATRRRFVAKRMFELLPPLLSWRSDFYINKKRKFQTGPV